MYGIPVPHTRKKSSEQNNIKRASLIQCLFRDFRAQFPYNRGTQDGACRLLAWLRRRPWVYCLCISLKKSKLPQHARIIASIVFAFLNFLPAAKPSGPRASCVSCCCSCSCRGDCCCWGGAVYHSIGQPSTILRFINSLRGGILNQKISQLMSLLTPALQFPFGVGSSTRSLSVYLSLTSAIEIFFRVGS